MHGLCDSSATSPCVAFEAQQVSPPSTGFVKHRLGGKGAGRGRGARAARERSTVFCCGLFSPILVAVSAHCNKKRWQDRRKEARLAGAEREWGAGARRGCGRACGRAGGCPTRMQIMARPPCAPPPLLHSAAPPLRLWVHLSARAIWLRLAYSDITNYKYREY
eukprot:SAG11_NODE_5203_length_1631_cov_10.832898_1_plen_163_part_00